MICSMAHRAAVLGGSGYMGAEVLRVLAGHPEIEVAAVGAASNAGTPVRELFPALGGAYGGLRYEALRPADLAGFDVVFCALPHGASQRLVRGRRETEVGREVDDVGDLPPVAAEP